MLIARASVLLLLCGSVAFAQGVMTAKTLTEAIEQHGSSGTSVEPASTPVPMWMGMRGGWQLMLHGNAFVANEQQQAQSERGRDAWFSTNWVMPMAQYAFGQQRTGDGSTGGLLTLRTMLSVEPATVGRRNYPELFQQGETAYGAPIVDGQHPHDFVMELAAMYDLRLSTNTLVSLYAAPVGDPAIGPTAYPHRLSASEDPIAALGHHQEDSTHIAFSVVTGGLAYRWARVELSGFHGAEPDEAHWHFQPSPNGLAIDSVATRVTLSPTPDWSGQYSLAHITSPEALYPGEDQQRQTVSVMYHHAFATERLSPKPTQTQAMDAGDMAMGGMKMGKAAAPATMKAMPPMHMSPEPRADVAVTALWGRTRSLADDSKENSYLLEVLLRFRTRNYLWTRLEDAGRSNELLLTPGTPLPQGFVESPLGHVAEYSIGYDHDVPLGPHLLAAPGVQLTVDRSPNALRSVYGATPTGEVLFVRFRVR